MGAARRYRDSSRHQKAAKGEAMTETLKQGTGEAPDIDGLVRHHHADLNGVRLHYVTAGEGEPMVFLHGFPGFWYVWRRQIAEFSRDHFVAAPDMRGHGLSSKRGEPLTTECGPWSRTFARSSGISHT